MVQDIPRDNSHGDNCHYLQDFCIKTLFGEMSYANFLIDSDRCI